MKHKYWETPEFKKLNSKWYDKLAESGFKDVETEDHSVRTDTAHFEDMDAVRTYYNKVSEYLHTGDFASPLEKAAWFVYSEGYSIREIARTLNRGRTSIERVIKAHIRQMNNGR
jgi:hypothetical protein